jgi:integrase
MMSSRMWPLVRDGRVAHACATLLLAAGVPPNVVQKRLGHKQIQMTLDLYAHVLPSMDSDAAARLGALLHGT